MTSWPPHLCSIGGLGVLANRGPKAGRKTRKRFGDFPMFRNIRLASFDEFVTLGFHVFVLLVELGVFVNCGPPGRVLGWVVFGLGFLSAVPGIDLFCSPPTGSPGLGCWGWHRGNYRELLVMFLCWGIRSQSQESICGSLRPPVVCSIGRVGCLCK